MRFMMIIKSDAQAEAGLMPSEELLTAMGKFNEEMVTAGVMKAGEGLQPSSKGTRVRFDKGTLTVKDGPFAEAKELVAGYWLIHTRSKAEAVAWAKRVPGPDVEIELRSLYELEDFAVDPSEQPGGWRDQEAELRSADGEAGGAELKVPGRKPGTTRYLLMIKADAMTEAGVPPSPEMLAAMGALMDGPTKTGHMMAGEGLKPSADGVRINRAGGKLTVTDGPFTESKELIAGYTMLQVAAKADAIDFAKRWLPIHASGGVDACEIEIRQVFELEDFPVAADEKPDGWRKQEQDLRERLGEP
jgi:hypothetical protein